MHISNDSFHKDNNDSFLLIDFSKLIIDESSLVFPEFRPFWQEVEPRFKDLALPFKRFWVYHPRQNGKASLKEILPAFTKENHKGTFDPSRSGRKLPIFKIVKKAGDSRRKKNCSGGFSSLLQIRQLWIVFNI